jgi:hypothetical protein
MASVTLSIVDLMDGNVAFVPDFGDEIGWGVKRVESDVITKAQFIALLTLRLWDVLQEVVEAPSLDNLTPRQQELFILAVKLWAANIPTSKEEKQDEPSAH